MRLTLQEEIHVRDCKLDQNPVAVEVMGSRREAGAVVLLNGHDVPVKLSPREGET